MVAKNALETSERIRHTRETTITIRERMPRELRILLSQGPQEPNQFIAKNQKI